MKQVALLTGNKGKLQEFRHELASIGVEVSQLTAEIEEIQADTLQEVVRHCLHQADAQRLGDVVLDDSGLFVETLNGFPGVYSAYAQKTLGCEGLLRLLDGRADRNARFDSCIGASIDGVHIVVTGTIHGTIATAMKGEGGFGFDPVFIPEEKNITFAQMEMGEKNAISHRGRAIRLLLAELEARGFKS
ncbi:MAG: RdgB/HAM1 family non-canonical purine NTP pyrophosphatase [Methanomassiliicoccales archaeon]